jgi:acyl dehydratase/NAD(P)-dependent dehydrogenase (short-subunit alcohol dehydrogenase family)
MRVFAAADQARFAAASGDVNPMHVDAVLARRTQAGAPVVHGMHAVLWALDALVAAGRITGPITEISVRFLKFVYAGAETALFVVRDSAASLRAELWAGGMNAVRLDVAIGNDAAEPAPSPLSARDVAVQLGSAAPDFAELRSCAGVLPVLAPGSAADMFPNLARRLGAARTATVMQLSALVGMVCPGLHAIFGGLRVRVAAESPGTERLSFAVTGADERVRMLTVAVAGGGIAGELTAFVRQAASERDLAEVAHHVGADEFAPATALIVGGSRGLGAATARAIAAGGGRVVVTYLAGESDARALAAELDPERCRILRYDACADAAPQLASLEWDVSQLYYFATPHIFRQKAGWWEPHRFAEFCAVYVDGFANVCAALRARGAELAAFYPSSVAVAEHARDLTEYSMAKAAGEMLCADMNRFERGIRVLVQRLPRVATDQTATLVAVSAADAVETMLPIVREMQALAVAMRAGLA